MAVMKLLLFSLLLLLPVVAGAEEETYSIPENITRENLILEDVDGKWTIPTRKQMYEAEINRFLKEQVEPEIAAGDKGDT